MQSLNIATNERLRR